MTQLEPRSKMDFIYVYKIKHLILNKILIYIIMCLTLLVQCVLGVVVIEWIDS